jgi:hypothetical protein
MGLLISLVSFYVLLVGYLISPHAGVIICFTYAHFIIPIAYFVRSFLKKALSNIPR